MQATPSNYFSFVKPQLPEQLPASKWAESVKMTFINHKNVFKMQTFFFRNRAKKAVPGPPKIDPKLLKIAEDIAKVVQMI